MTAADKETGHFRGAGGTVWEMNLPLPEVYAQQLAKGELIRVSPDGSPWTGGPTPVLGNVEIPVDPRDAEIARLQAELAKLQVPSGGRPRDSGSKADWVAYAVGQGMAEADAEAATRDELVAKFPKE